MYYNHAIIIGNLTRDPEVKALPSGIQVATFSLATNRVYKDKEGRKQESTDYHNIVVFGRQAETSGQYLKKGQSVLVEGRIQTRSWDDQAGKKNYRTEIVAEKVQFGPKSSGAGGGSSNQSSAEDFPANSSASGKGDSGPVEYPQEEINPEDIPF